MKAKLFKTVPLVGYVCMGVMEYDSEEELEKLKEYFNSYTVIGEKTQNLTTMLF